MENKVTGNRYWLLTFTLLLTLLQASPTWADLVAKVDRQEMTDADVLRLTVRLENTSTSPTPDFSGIERDFEILNVAGPSRFSSTSIINGRTSVTSAVTWELSLRALRTGDLRIPALSVGADRSEPIMVKVSPQTAATRRQASQYVFFDTGVDTNTTYVQGQVIYTVKLFYVDAVGGDFPPPPEIEDAVVETIGEERRFDTVVNSRRYYVLEKRYAIYPQRSGTLTIPRETFVGTRGRSSLSYGSDRVMAFSDAHEITVKPKPAAFTDATWLPARKVTLTDSWKQAPPRFVVGEPVNRTITLTAEGVAGALLPTLPQPEVSGAKIYADPVDISELPTDQGLIATQMQSIGIVPTQPGIIEFPPVTLQWWNTLTDKPEVVTLKAERYVVAAAPTDATTPAVPAAVDPATPASPATEVAGKAATSIWTYVGWLLAVIFAVLWLLTLRAWMRAPATHGQAHQRARQLTDDASEPALFKRLEAACTGGNPLTVRQALQQWGQVRCPQCRSLHELGRQLDKDAGDARASTAIAELERALYAPRTGFAGIGDWRSDELLEALRALHQTRSKVPEKSRVPALNPS